MAMPKAKITYQDGRVVEAIVGPKAQVAVERQYNVSLADDKLVRRLEHIYYMAYAALWAAGLEPRDFDAWLGDVADVEEVEQAPDPDPTQAGGSAISSEPAS
jgi:hypothetical protein